MTLVLAGRILTPTGPLTGSLTVDGERISALDSVTTVGPPMTGVASVAHVPADGWIVPGLVDIHCHGGGGHSFDAGRESARSAAAYHRRQGVTSIVASLVSAPHDVLLRQVRELAPLVDAGVLAGIHLEGPYLSPARRGAHALTALRDPDPREIVELLTAGGGTVRMMTLAPELPGALAAIDLLVQAGVTVAVGHTDATADQTRAAISHRASVATHLFNGMRGLHHREAGPVLALAEADSVYAELIADGHHLAPDVLRATMRLLGPRSVLVTDAVAAAGSPDGRYRLGGSEVVLVDGVVRTGEGSLAGSTLSLATAVRNAAAAGIPLPDAVHAATAAPAVALGLAAGALSVGAVADAVVLDGSLSVTGVLHGGRWQ